MTELTYWSIKPDYEQNTPTQQGGGHAVMIWGCMTWGRLCSLAFVHGRLNSKAYIELLEENLSGSLVKWMSENQHFYKMVIIFQQDNDPKYKSKLAKAWFDNQNLTVLPWPANSPDMNIIEHVWDFLDVKIRARNPLPKSKDSLWQALQEE